MEAITLAGVLATLVPIIFGVVGAIANLSLGIALMLITVVFGMLIRVFFMFVKAYLSIILLVLFGPLIIAFSAFSPGGFGGTIGWFKSLLANILIFPVAGFIMAIGALIIERFNVSPADFWGPPMIGNNPRLLTAAIGVGIILILPEVEGMISKALSVAPTPMGAMPTMDIAGEVRKGVEGGIQAARTGARGYEKLQARFPKLPKTLWMKKGP